MYLDFSQANFSFAPLVLDMLSFLMDAIQTNFQQASAVGSSSRAQQALRELHTVDKAVEMTDQLMVSGRHRGRGPGEPARPLGSQRALGATRRTLESHPWAFRTWAVRTHDAQCEKRHVRCVF